MYMAKGRRLTTSRSERLLGSNGYGQSMIFPGESSPDLGEEDVWSMVDSISSGGDFPNGNSISNPYVNEERSGVSIFNRRHRRISGEDSHVGGLSMAFEDSGSAASSRIVHQFRGNDTAASPRGHQMATSAPVNVPDWSKILRMNSIDSLQAMDDGVEDGDSEMVPPHEYLARSRNMAATSVFEGVGRTLKGRDMSRVRDAVWSRTGFDG